MLSENENESYQSPSGNREDQRFKDIRAISRINKTTSTLFQSQKGLTVGACHDVSELSYDTDRRYIHVVKVSFRLYTKKKNSQFSK